MIDLSKAPKNAQVAITAAAWAAGEAAANLKYFGHAPEKHHAPENFGAIQWAAACGYESGYLQSIFCQAFSLKLEGRRNKDAMEDVWMDDKTTG